MRQARLKFSPDQGAGFYHCVSRVVDRQLVFEADEKDKFVELMRECERFCEVRVLTFCVMSNHFHVLLEVGQRPQRLPSMNEILSKLETLSGHQNVDMVRQELARCRRQRDVEAEGGLLARYHDRMWDLGAFMKLLKQRFTQWYNPRAGRRGTLWESRYKSVLVDPTGTALLAMAAYIDLNSVRAGLVLDPEDYPWCGYAEARAGRKRAREGLRRVVAAFQESKAQSPSQALSTYRACLLNQDTAPEAATAADVPLQDRTTGRRKRGRNPKRKTPLLKLGDYVRQRVRYFCDGAVFGSREFVESVFRANRQRFGSKRKTGARRLKGVATELYALRDLQLNVFGKS